MNAMQLLTGPFAQAIGWALLHLLWQATIVAGILAAVLALVPRQNASARYVASCAALTIVFAMFVTTAIREYDPAAAPIATAPVASAAESGEAVSLVKIPIVIATTAAESWRDRALDAVATARQSLPTIVALWFAGVVLLTSRLLVSWLRARRLITHGTQEAGLEWQRVAARLSNALGLRRAVRLLESATIEVPSVLGSLRPVILLPASTLTGLTPGQIEMVLAHELAHIRRHDFLVNLLQAFVETLMFYHPAVWWMSRRVRIERENCCDDLAVAVCGDRVQYAKALTRLEELRASALPVVVAANGGSLLDRIRRIAASRPEATGISARWTAAAVMMALLVLALALPSASALAQREDPQPTPATSKVDVVEARTDDEDVDVDADDENVDVDVDDDVNVDVDADTDIDFDFDIPEPPEAPEAPEAPEVPGAPAAPMAPPAPGVPAPPHAPAPPLAPIAIDVPDVSGIAPIAIAAAVPGIRAAAAIAPVAVNAAMARVLASVDRGDLDIDLDDLDERVREDRDRDRSRVDRDRRFSDNGKLTVDELISLRAVGVTPEYIKEMRGYFPDLTIGEVTGMRAVGVSTEYIKDMRAAGFVIDEARDATSMRAVGVTPEYVRQMRDAGFEVKTARAATSLHAVGVTPEYVRQIRAAGLEIRSEKDATSLRALGVDAEWLKDMRAAGVKIETAKDATSLRALGVTPRLVKQLSDAGYSNLSVKELTRLAAAGIDGDFIRDMEQYRKK